METHFEPIFLQADSCVHQLSKLTTQLAEKVADEYINNPFAPIRKYRPWAIEHKGTIFFIWRRCDAQGRYWDLIESSLNKRVHSNCFRSAKPAEREIVIATERRLAATREVLIYLLSMKEAFERLSNMEEA